MSQLNWKRQTNLCVTFVFYYFVESIKYLFILTVVMQTLNDLVEYLQNHVGPKITSYVAGFNNVNQLNQIPFGVTDVVEMRLRHAYETVRLISEAYDDKTVKSWLFGNNTKLEEAHAFVLRHAETLEDLSCIVPLAKEFSSR